MKKNTIHRFLFALCFAFAVLLPSCEKHSEIVLDTSDPLELAPGVQWAVVTVPYTAFRKETSWDSQSIDYCKKGECFPVMAKTIVADSGTTETWCRFENGWLPESTISIYQNKLRAAKAAELLK